MPSCRSIGIPCRRNSPKACAVITSAWGERNDVVFLRRSPALVRGCLGRLRFGGDRAPLELCPSPSKPPPSYRLLLPEIVRFHRAGTLRARADLFRLQRE